MGYSLGKINYCLQALKGKGLVQSGELSQQHQQDRIPVQTHARRHQRESHHHPALFSRKSWKNTNNCSVRLKR
ncbi:hypothetical protein [Salicola sp. Rm-C-2C1-2]|uniref:hypothetical protein n=1 Tax=Salicola sp. Rm-C-2C1-2 TaxID=3141321 RepID=UPI0032E4ACEA